MHLALWFIVVRPQTPQTTDKGPGLIIGGYTLLEQIGEGGFGVVYMAEQAEPVRRSVALKIIKPGMDTKESLPASKLNARRWH